MLHEKIKEFEKHSWAIKRYASERWGTDVPCPLRLVVNPYYGCSMRCSYCYVWYDKEQKMRKDNFRKALVHDIERAKKIGITDLAVEVSSSTDPFQAIEYEQGDSLFAINELLKGGFKVVIVTKNPAMLLEEDYIHLLKDPNVFLDVTVTSFEKKNIKGGKAVREEPSMQEKIDAIKRIIEQGKEVRVKIEPVIPSCEGVIGQSAEDLEGIVRSVAKVGVKLIIAKTLRLNAGMPESSIRILLSFFKENGTIVGENYILSESLRRELLLPIVDACRKYNVRFCPCCDNDIPLPGEMYSCNVSGECL